MTLTNYWWLVIWLFVIAVVAIIVPVTKKEYIFGGKETRWKMFPAILLAFPYVVWAGFRLDNFGDTATYRKIFHEAPGTISQIPSYLSEHTKDKGFSVLTIVLKSILGNADILFFLIIAIFQIGCIVYVFRKYSSDYWLSFFMFVVSTDYLSWMYNGIRQFIAVVGTFICFELILKKRYVPAICIILLASTIHGTALLMLPIIFIIQGKAWNKKTLFFIFSIMIIMGCIDQFTPFLDNMLSDTQYSDLVTNEIWTTDDGTNILRVLFYSMPAILSLLGKKYIDAADNPMINLCVNCSCVTMALYLLASVSSGIYIGRLPIYTTLQGYIAVPWIIDHMFTTESAKLVKLGLIGGFLIFFYFQMHFAWAII